MRIIIIIFLGVVALSCRTSSIEEQDRPNVLFILVDDLGWRDLGVTGSDLYQTPHVDRLASEGVRFTNGYSSCTVCSPTRASIMTGKYPATINCTDWIEGWKLKGKPLKVPDWTMYMDTSEYTMAKAFRNAGYNTAHFGKWHLGEDSLYWPENQGFDFNMGGWKKGSPNRKKGKYNGYFPPFGNPRIEDKEDDQYLTERLADEAVRYIQTNNPQKTGKPFFLNFWFYNVHTPLMAKEEKVKKYKSLTDTTKLHQNPVYAGMVEHMDDAVGSLIEALKEEGLYDNTIIVFTSDNGGLMGRWGQVTSNAPFRSGKGDMFEGGVRVPVIVKALNVTDPGVSDHPVISMDFYPTLMSLTGIEIPIAVKSQLEGQDLTQVLKSQKPNKRELFWHYPHYHVEGASPYSAVRSGNWKLIYYYETETSELFDLSSDIGETTDLSANSPEIKQDLLTKLDDWKKKVGAQLPTPNPKLKQ